MEKTFMIRCPKCKWTEMTTGLSEDLKAFFEIQQSNVGFKVRKFRCPKCGSSAAMKRIKGNT